MESIARAAGDVLMKHFRKLDGYEKKGSIDLLTVADKESEAVVIEAIRRQFPDHAILAEEGGKLGDESSDYLWVIDPLDGTTNYAHGLRIFAVSIGLVHKGEPIAGVILAPAFDELYSAALGNGATRNGEPIHVSDTAVLGDALVVTGFPYSRAQHADLLGEMLKAVLVKTQGLTRFGAAAWDMACVAAGHLDAFYEWGLQPWDMAAGIVIVREAGGVVTGLLPDEPLDLYKPRTIASNGRVHRALQDVLLTGGVERVPK